MTIKIDAIYRNGQLEFKEPVQLADGTPVRVEITPVDEDYDPLDAVIGIGDSGPAISLAERHDEFLYGIKPRDEKPS
jgi:predicted DNA-binding antitoxin AbrB/MazE fold protein